MSTIAASTAAGSRISGSRSGGIVGAIGGGNPANLAALGLNNQQAAGAAPEPESTDPSYLSDANSAYSDAYSAMMDNKGPGGRANAQSAGLMDTFNSAKEARDAARLRFKSEEAGMSPEEYSQDQVSQYGGGYGRRLGIGNMMSQYGNIRNGVNATQNQLVSDAQQSYTDNPSEQETSESKLRNPLGQELQPMNAVGFKNSAITNAGEMFGQSYGGLFGGAAKKYK